MDNARLIALADQCVMCGLCLPSCPTYGLAREEGESPRGRIALIRGLAERRLTPTPGLIRHLDQCLACRRCEAVCPAQVRYGELIAGVRALPAMRRQRRMWLSLLTSWLTSRHWRWLLLSLKPLLRLGMPWWRRGHGAWAHRLRLLAELPAPERPQATRPVRIGGARVAIVPGCIAAPYEAALREQARQLLAATGETTVEVEAGLCCGTLARHADQAELAARQQHRLVDAVRACGAGVVLGTATGCQAELNRLFADLPIQLRELHVHLAERLRRRPLSFRPMSCRVAVHRPCSQRLLGPGSADAVDELLALIPGLSLTLLPDLNQCCGAAGQHFIEQPAHADALRSRVLAKIDAAAPDLIVSANIGCRLFLGGGLAAAGRTIPVLHPVALLARQFSP